MIKNKKINLKNVLTPEFAGIRAPMKFENLNLNASVLSQGFK